MNGTWNENLSRLLGLTTTELQKIYGSFQFSVKHTTYVGFDYY